MPSPTAIHVSPAFIRPPVAAPNTFKCAGRKITRTIPGAVFFSSRQPPIRLTLAACRRVGSTLQARWAPTTALPLQATPTTPQVTSLLLPQNGLVESFHARLRDECLNVSWFENLWDARRKIAAWKEEYNERRPHSSLGYQTPAAYARQLAASAGSALRATPPDTAPQRTDSVHANFI